jgi:uncharacterized protein YhfF/ribosomal protein S18 acetylase RimI-like enzyme
MKKNDEIVAIRKEDAPRKLLLLADPDQAKIDSYLDKAIIYVCKRKKKVIGILVLEQRGKNAEIKNIAVKEKYQNQKIGRSLIERAIEWSKRNRMKSIKIKTGSNGNLQLNLYQKMGFRITRVYPDFFLKEYKQPIFENDLQCSDQVELEYKIYSENELQKMVKQYWKRFTKENPEYADAGYTVWHFCYGEYLPNLLLNLVRQGIKTGTSSAPQVYEPGEKKPKKGDISVVTYGNGVPGCIIKTVKVKKKKFSEINEKEAFLEGEGDRSLEQWRDAHARVFQEEYKRIGKKFHDDIPVIFEEFKVLSGGAVPSDPE